MKMKIGGYTNPLVVEKINQYKKQKMSEKKLYYRLGHSEGYVIMELSGCMEWIKADVEEQFNADMPEDEKPVYMLAPIWLTDEEYDALPESEY